MVRAPSDNRVQWISQRGKIKPVVVETVFKLNSEFSQNHKRQPKQPPPEGGISIRAASRKYGIPSQTISRWVKKGLIAFILVTKKEKYINEKEFAELVRRYKENPGQGKWTIKE